MLVTSVNCEFELLIFFVLTVSSLHVKVSGFGLLYDAGLRIQCLELLLFGQIQQLMALPKLCRIYGQIVNILVECLVCGVSLEDLSLVNYCCCLLLKKLPSIRQGS